MRDTTRGDSVCMRHSGWICAICLMLFSRLASAGDGSIRWRTLHADGVDISFPQGYEAFAQRVANTWQDARRTLGEILPGRSQTLQITIDDFTDSANGYATVIPYDHVHLQACPPTPGSELGDHGDWIRALVFHEYTHILHLGDVEGLPDVVNHVFGRILVPNAYLPRFMTEGMATWSETRHTGSDLAVAHQGGRVDSAIFLGELRAAVLGGTLPTLSQLTGTPLQWPRASSWYLYGSLLLDDLAQQHGHASIRAFADAMAWKVVPFGIQNISRELWGKSLTRGWLEAQVRLKARVRTEVQDRLGVDLGEEPSQSKDLARVQAEGDGQQLTFDGEWRGRIRPWADGRSAVVAHAGSREQLRKIERIWPDGRVQVVHTCQLDCDEPMLSDDGKWLLFTESRRFKRLYLFRDLIALRLDEQGVPTGPEIQLTTGARLRSPHLSWRPGHWRVHAIQLAQGRTWRQVMEFPLDLSQVQTPMIVPLPHPDQAAPLGQTDDDFQEVDGKLLWTRHSGARRQVFQDGKPLGPGAEWVSDVQAEQGGPTLALVEMENHREVAILTGDHWYLQSRTLTGIASATRVGNAIFSVRQGAYGLDVFRIDARSIRLPKENTSSISDIPYAPSAVVTEEGWYNPFRTAWPRTWRPILLATGDRLATLPGGIWIGATTGGFDALRLWNWSVSGQIRDDGSDPIVSGQIELTRWEPTFSLRGGYQHGSTLLRRGFSYISTPTSLTGVALGVEWDLPRLRDVWAFNFGWRLVNSSLIDPRYAIRYPYDPAGPIPLEPWTGVDAFLDFGIRWQYAASSPDAITTESLHNAAILASWSDHWTGGGRRRIVLQSATAHRWPLGKRVVLDLSGNLDLVPIATDSSPAFGVRGIQPTPVNILAGSGLWPMTVRGLAYDPILLAGNGLAWGTVQIHLPLLDIGQGLDALPIWFGRLQFLPFVDAASAFLPPPGAQRYAGQALSSGAELLLNWELGYGIDGTLRLGAARAFLPQNNAYWLVLGL